MKVHEFIDALDGVITKTIIWLSTCSLGITFLVMLCQVFMRRLFSRPIIWVEDFAVFVFIWITFLGAAVLYQRRTLSSVDTFVALLSAKWKRIIQVIINMVVFASSLYLLKLCFDFVLRQQKLGHKLGGVLGIPSWMASASVVAAMFLMVLFSLTSIIKTILIAAKTKE
jgi:TRAP-type C4-dicarboxylate transport system permease small subunit